MCCVMCKVLCCYVKRILDLEFGRISDHECSNNNFRNGFKVWTVQS